MRNQLSTHSIPNLIPNKTGHYRQHCSDTDPEHRKDKCININADVGVWFYHRCRQGGGFNQHHPLSKSKRQQRQAQPARAKQRQAPERQKAIARLRQQWDTFNDTGTSAYLQRKGLPPIDGLRYGRDKYGSFAAMSLYGPGGDFRGYHWHYDNGDKKIAYGTQKQGAHFLIPGSNCRRLWQSWAYRDRAESCGSQSANYHWRG